MSNGAFHERDAERLGWALGSSDIGCCGVLTGLESSSWRVACCPVKGMRNWRKGLQDLEHEVGFSNSVCAHIEIEPKALITVNNLLKSSCFWEISLKSGSIEMQGSFSRPGNLASATCRWTTICFPSESYHLPLRPIWLHSSLNSASTDLISFTITWQLCCSHSPRVKEAVLPMFIKK